MNIALWVLQVLLALHTATGAMWKLTNSEQSVPSLSALPHAVWLALIGVELAATAGLVLPALNRSLGMTVPAAAIAIALEMFLFAGVHFTSGVSEHGEVIYWLVVAVFCAFIAYGRLVLAPL